MMPTVEFKIDKTYQMMLTGEISIEMYQMLLSVYADEILEEHNYDQNGRKVV